MGHQHQRRSGQLRDKGKVLERVVRQRHAVGSIDGVDVGGQQECVTVGRRRGNCARRDDGVATGLVLDHYRHAERCRQALGQSARHHVRAAAGRERHDDAHRLAWKISRACLNRQTQCEHTEQE